jgi:hypothetical protein
MPIEDVVLVATVREDIRHKKIRFKGVEVLRRVEAAQAGKLSSFEGVNSPRVPNQELGSTIGATANPNTAEDEMDGSDGEESREVLVEGRGKQPHAAQEWPILTAHAAALPCTGTCGLCPDKTETKAEVEAIHDPKKEPKIEADADVWRAWGALGTSKANAKAKSKTAAEAKLSTKQPGWNFGPSKTSSM